MAIIFEANYSKKIGLPNYSSHQFSVTLRVELPSTNLVPTEATRLYQLLQECVDREIRVVGYLPGRNEPPIPRDVMPPAFASPQAPADHGHNGTGAGNGQLTDPWKCSDKQKSLILKIVEEHQLDKNAVETLARERFNTPVKGLNKLQASGLIAELLEQHPTGNGKGKNGNGGYRRAPERQGTR